MWCDTYNRDRVLAAMQLLLRAVGRWVLRRSVASSLLPSLPAPRVLMLQQSRWLATPRKGEAALSLPELRLVTAKGSIGVMKPKEAMKIAKERDMELVEVSSSATPPVWRLMPPVSQEQQQAEADELLKGSTMPGGTSQQLIRRPARPGKDPKPLKVKEVRLTDKSEVNDVQTKANYANRFLKKGHIVKVIALNTGQVCQETNEANKPRAKTLVEFICAQCTELGSATAVVASSSQGGRMNRNTIGLVSATLTPKSKGPS